MREELLVSKFWLQVLGIGFHTRSAVGAGSIPIRFGAACSSANGLNPEFEKTNEQRSPQ